MSKIVLAKNPIIEANSKIFNHLKKKHLKYTLQQLKTICSKKI